MLPIPLPGTELTDRLAKQNRIYSTDSVGLEYYDGNFPLFQPDDPMTPEEMQASVQRTMRGFYGPRHLLAVAASIIAFPVLVLWLHNLGAGWQMWYRRWITNVYRSGGWLLLENGPPPSGRTVSSPNLPRPSGTVPKRTVGPTAVERCTSMPSCATARWTASSGARLQAGAAGSLQEAAWDNSARPCGLT